MVRIGILTYFASINYGAFLQTYALQEFLRKRYVSAAEVEVINYESESSYLLYLNRARTQEKLFFQYEKFIQSRKVLRLSDEKLITNDIGQVKEFLYEKYDIIIVGSDEIWKTNSSRGFPNAYWLNFDLGDTVYMAYAVSGRNDYKKLTEELQEYMRSSIKRFAYIGTRDEVTRRELLEIQKRKIERNCDPVFLDPQLFERRDEKNRVKKKYGLPYDRPIISIMMHNDKIGFRLCRMLRNENQVVFLYDMNSYSKANNLTALSPFEWSEVISISDLVITEYFHAVVFSILYKIPFMAIEDSEMGRGKIENLLCENFMQDKFLYLQDYKDNAGMLTADLYTKGRKEMQEYTPFLAEQAIKNECDKASTFFVKLEEIIGL